MRPVDGVRRQAPQSLFRGQYQLLSSRVVLTLALCGSWSDSTALAGDRGGEAYRRGPPSTPQRGIAERGICQERKGACGNMVHALMRLSGGDEDDRSGLGKDDNRYDYLIGEGSAGDSESDGADSADEGDRTGKWRTSRGVWVRDHPDVLVETSESVGVRATWERALRKRCSAHLVCIATRRCSKQIVFSS
jgi:hypothetical protein